MPTDLAKTWTLRLDFLGSLSCSVMLCQSWSFIYIPLLVSSSLKGACPFHRSIWVPWSTPWLACSEHLVEVSRYCPRVSALLGSHPISFHKSTEAHKRNFCNFNFPEHYLEEFMHFSVFHLKFFGLWKSLWFSWKPFPKRWPECVVISRVVK